MVLTGGVWSVYGILLTGKVCSVYGMVLTGESVECLPNVIDRGKCVVFTE